VFYTSTHEASRRPRIATYNVNGVNGRLTNLLAWLAQADPDIVCLQELKAPDESFRPPPSSSQPTSTGTSPRR
jgi:exonuclease III